MQTDQSSDNWDPEEYYNGWTFHPYNFSSQNDTENNNNSSTTLVSTNFPQYSNISQNTTDNRNLHIWISRSQPRHKITGEICFDITYHPDTDKEKTTRTQITKLIDLNDQTVKYEEIANAINNWINVAIQYPDKNRKCLFCNKRTIKSLILCKYCKNKYYETMYA